MTPVQRATHLSRIRDELRLPQDDWGDDETRMVSAMQDLCFQLYSREVSEVIAIHLGVTISEVRKALDQALKWVPKTHHTDIGKKE